MKPGGIVVYSTCTIEPDENIDIVNRFLENHQEFQLVSLKNEIDDSLINSSGTVQTFPNINKMDGAFAVKIKKLD